MEPSDLSQILLTVALVLSTATAIPRLTPHRLALHSAALGLALGTAVTMMFFIATGKPPPFWHALFGVLALLALVAAIWHAPRAAGMGRATDKATARRHILLVGSVWLLGGASILAVALR